MFLDEDFFLKDSIELYSNMASIGNYHGRLQAKLEINPALRITWNFESFDGIEDTPNIGDRGIILDPIKGYQFGLEDSAGSLSGTPRPSDPLQGYQINGTSSTAWVGIKELESSSFSFYLPNAKFLVECLEGSMHYREYSITYQPGEELPLENTLPQRAGIGGRWKCSLGDDWTVSFYVSNDTEDWLKTERGHGTYLVAAGIFYTTSNEKPDLHEISLKEARDRIGRLCWMLSFANGGYLGPVAFLSQKFSEGTEEETALFGAYRTTPLELLGITWLVTQTNLCKYVSCLATFERMTTQEPWNEVFELILIWYLQAIQPATGQGPGKPWPIVANALGAALERLSFTILNQEFGEDYGDNARQRIRNLLKKVGIDETDEDDDRFVDVFVDTRNDATHARQENKYTNDEMMLSLQYAKLWVEEILLWRLGYNGAYRRRIPGSRFFAFEEPRYNLESRKEDW